ncbi:DUF4231 domain-containing protein [Streptomyces apricus]|uniref:DUF4231 domain-containing protein n=1 Tax=Streptomyces apricus TaxID=1828112 RepID=A0A5A9ZTQ1_9ACTN|nr:DUF4231 domain-containing protein [Streptomyces apricus]
MSTGGGQAAAQEVWRAQSIWSQAAGRQKAAIDRARAATLGATVAAGVLGAASAQLIPISPPVGRTLAFLAMLAAGVAPFVAVGAAPDRIRRWLRLRSVSEEVKSQVYVHLAGLAQYRQRARRDAELLERTGTLLAQVVDLEPETRGLRPADRPLPSVIDTDGYVEHRLRFQLEGYYRPRADEMARRARLIERYGQALAVLSVLLGAAAGAFGAQSTAVWIPVVTAVSASVVSHGASARYARQQIEYSTTAGELERLLRWWQQRAPATDADADRLAEWTEHVVSVQNEGWMAKWIAD